MTDENSVLILTSSLSSRADVDSKADFIRHIFKTLNYKVNIIDYTLNDNIEYKDKLRKLNLFNNKNPPFVFYCDKYVGGYDDVVVANDNEDIDNFLKETDHLEMLNNSTLVIDGCNFAYTSTLFVNDGVLKKRLCKSLGIYYDRINNVMHSLLRLNVCIYVIMDGICYETIKKRKKSKKNFEKFKFNAEFSLMSVFIECLNFNDIHYFYCDGPADDYIVKFANGLKCPVVSADSDFFIGPPKFGFNFIIRVTIHLGTISPVDLIESLSPTGLSKYRLRYSKIITKCNLLKKVGLQQFFQFKIFPMAEFWSKLNNFQECICYANKFDTESEMYSDLPKNVQKIWDLYFHTSCLIPQIEFCTYDNLDKIFTNNPIEYYPYYLQKFGFIQSQNLIYLKYLKKGTICDTFSCDYPSWNSTIHSSYSIIYLIGVVYSFLSNNFFYDTPKINSSFNQSIINQNISIHTILSLRKRLKQIYQNFTLKSLTRYKSMDVFFEITLKTFSTAKPNYDSSTFFIFTQFSSIIFLLNLWSANSTIAKELSTNGFICILICFVLSAFFNSCPSSKSSNYVFLYEFNVHSYINSNQNMINKVSVCCNNICGKSNICSLCESFLRASSLDCFPKITTIETNQIIDNEINSFSHFYQHYKAKTCSFYTKFALWEVVKRRKNALENVNTFLDGALNYYDGRINWYSKKNKNIKLCHIYTELSKLYVHMVELFDILQYPLNILPSHILFSRHYFCYFMDKYCCDPILNDSKEDCHYKWNSKLYIYSIISIELNCIKDSLQNCDKQELKYFTTKLGTLCFQIWTLLSRSA
ncbi:hypothetical protein A3Q56_01960 [Intoshia linei]|uniref:Uncharacterized protein n=1 Tax=Intoshia linei TaxID=1819745 RepID=A0A177B9J3_9BILA|nr:hypothetical protein A3Q56_01960 [Intoshia linei]